MPLETNSLIHSRFENKLDCMIMDQRKHICKRCPIDLKCTNINRLPDYEGYFSYYKRVTMVGLGLLATSEAIQ